jgi:hypothetical protein
MSKRPGDEGCRRKRKHISMTTRHGKNSTSPRGTDIVEFFFSRIRCLKNDDCSLCEFRSASSAYVCAPGKVFGAEEKRFVRNDILLEESLMAVTT